MPSKKSLPRAAWLLKTEPHVFSLDDLKAAKDRTTRWDGVRNYQARNLLRDSLKLHDAVLIYHSSTKPLAIVGTAHVVREGYPDPTQFDPASPYYDPGAKPTAPRWYAVDVQYTGHFAVPVLRDVLAHHPKLHALPLLQKGQRLSVQPVPPEAWGLILALAKG